MDKILEKIAQERLGITLERRGNDGDDFHDISVWALKEMLEKAYQAGQDSVQTKNQTSADTKTKLPLVQKLKKNGEWGKARETVRYGNETDEQVVERLNTLNPAEKFRIAQ